MASGPPARRAVQVAQPLAGGVPRYVIDLVRGLANHGWSVDVMCPRESWIWPALEGCAGVTLHPMSPRRRPTVSDVSVLLRLVRLARVADVVHAHSSKAGLLVRVAAVVAARTRHCLFSPHAWSFLGFEGWRRSVLVQFERLAAHWCRSIVTVSSDERSAGLHEGVGRPSQYHVVRTGVPLNRYSQANEPDPGSIIMVNRLTAQKRPALAVRAMAELVRDVPAAHLSVIGDGPLREETERLAKDLELDGVVKFLGYRTDVPAILARGCCLLLTSSYEGLPLTVLEAMAAGLPVVATSSAGTREAVVHGSTGLLVEPTPTAIASGLRELLSDPAHAQAMGMRARTEVRRFSYEEMLQSMCDAYEETAQG